MNRLLFLLCCIEVLGKQHCSADITSGVTETEDEEYIPSDEHSSTDFTSATSGSFETSTVMITQTVFPISSSPSASPSPGLSHPKVTTTTAPTTTTRTTAPAPTSPLHTLFFKKECLTLYMVAGGLIIACTILLISTFMLSWKVCRLNRHIKMLSSNSDLISTSEYWLGTAKKSKSNSGTQARETTVLMSDIGQTQEEAPAEVATKEEGEKVKEEGQKGEENKEEAADGASVEKASAGEDKKETPAAAAENSSSSKPQEEPSDNKPTTAEAGTPSEGTQEPKDTQKS